MEISQFWMSWVILDEIMVGYKWNWGGLYKKIIIVDTWRVKLYPLQNQLGCGGNLSSSIVQPRGGLCYSCKCWSVVGAFLYLWMIRVEGILCYCVWINVFFYNQSLVKLQWTVLFKITHCFLKTVGWSFWDGITVVCRILWSTGRLRVFQFVWL